MMDNHYNTKRTVETTLFGGRHGTRSRNSIGLRAHSLHGAEPNQSLEQSKNRDFCASDPVELLTLFFSKSHFCCRYIITQKKPQQDAEASTTTAMVSLLQCEGR